MLLVLILYSDGECNYNLQGCSWYCSQKQVNFVDQKTNNMDAEQYEMRTISVTSLYVCHKEMPEMVNHKQNGRYLILLSILQYKDYHNLSNIREIFILAYCKFVY